LFEIGNTLREARLRRNLDFRQLEQATKIRGRYLRALEEEDFDGLPAETYVRGFLRSYAEFLGLDGQLYVDEYNSRFVTGEEYPVLRPRRSKPKRGGASALQTNVVLLALTAIAVMTALVIAAWKFSADSSTAKPNAVTPQAAVPTASGSQRPSATRRDPTRANVLITAPHRSSLLEVHAVVPNAAKDKNKFPLLYQGTLQKGQSQRFVAKKLWIKAARPANLVVRLNGERVPIGAKEPVVVLVTANSITSAQPQ
jgi:cytoskeletal protein RodZ